MRINDLGCREDVLLHFKKLRGIKLLIMHKINALIGLSRLSNIADAFTFWAIFLFVCKRFHKLILVIS